MLYIGRPNVGHNLIIEIYKISYNNISVCNISSPEYVISIISDKHH